MATGWLAAGYLDAGWLAPRLVANKEFSEWSLPGVGNIPQTVLALRGSNGVDKGALKPPLRPSRCRGADFLVNTVLGDTYPQKTVKLQK